MLLIVQVQPLQLQQPSVVFAAMHAAQQHCLDCRVHAHTSAHVHACAHT